MIKYTQTQMIDNILSVYALSTSDEFSLGQEWYKTACNEADKISQETRIDFGKIVYCIAALSPRNKWDRNISDVRNLATQLSLEVSCGTFNANKLKALQCLLSTDFDFKRDIDKLAVKGYKVKAFAKLIYNPCDYYSVCIDTHAIGISHYHRYSVEDKQQLCGIFGNEKRYDAIAEAYRKASHTLDILPNKLQATTWLTWKRIHRI
jgi:hypothetical protein